MEPRSASHHEPIVIQDRAHFALLGGLAIVAGTALWIPPLSSSLRLDETATYWIVRDGIRATVERAVEFQGESPAYYLIQRLATGLFGTSEAAMRLPSILAMVGVGFLLYRLGNRLGGRDVGLLAAILFVIREDMIFAAGDARPYALAILALVGATLALVRWVEDGRHRDAAIYVLLAATAMYIHYIAGLSLLAHFIYVLWRRDRLSLMRFALGLLAVGLLMLPALPHLRSLYLRRDSLEVPFAVTLPGLFTVLVPALLVGTALLGFAIARFWDRPTIGATGFTGAWPLVSAWWVLPALLLYMVSTFSATTLFEPRFFFFSSPALALAGGLAISSIDPPRSRRVVITVMVAISILGLGSRTHSGDDWRSAAEVARSITEPDTVVLIRPAFIESNQLDWVTAQDKIPYLSAPLSPYPIDGDIVLLPYSVTEEAMKYLGDVAQRRLSAGNQFLLVNDYGGFQNWLLGRLPSFSARTLTEPGSLVTVVLFERQPS